MVCFHLRRKGPGFAGQKNNPSIIKRGDLTLGNSLSVSLTRSNKCMGMLSFAVAGPTKWNMLLQAIRTLDTVTEFRQQLKTYLFTLSYSPSKSSLPYDNIDMWVFSGN